MKVKLTITLSDAEHDRLGSIPDLERYIVQGLTGEIEVPNYSHIMIWDLDTYNRTIKTEWEEPLPKGI